MAKTDPEALEAEVRAAVAAGRAEDAFRLAFHAVEAAERERSAAHAALALAAEGCWDDAIARLEVFPSEGDRFGALAALALVALSRAQADPAERVLRAIEALPTGAYDPLRDYAPGLVLWLVGRACDLGVAASLREEVALEEVWSGLCATALANGLEAHLIPAIPAIPSSAVRTRTVVSLGQGLADREAVRLETLLELLALEPAHRTTTRAVARASLAATPPGGSLFRLLVDLLGLPALT
ncbi:MAG: hypothetical protein R3F62_17060 [Planctomycetota bacterium]